MKKIKICKCGCGEKFVKTNSMQKVVNFAHYKIWLTTTEDGQKEMLKKIAQAKKSIDLAEKEKFNNIKDKVTKWDKKLQSNVQLIARLIDKGLPCLATNKHGQMHGGHIYSRGACSNMRYNLHNIHRQSARSNHWQSDDIKLREGLIKEYGYMYMSFVSGLNKTPQPKLSYIEYKEIYKKSLNIVNELKKADKEYSKVERIELRNKYNLYLSIYDKIYCIHTL